MSHTHPRPLGIAALLFATAGWGSMFLVGKAVLPQVGPVWLTFIRYSVSALLFAALLLPRGAGPWRKLRLHAGPLALRGGAGFGVFSVLLFVGLAHSVPSHGAVIVATTPMTTQLVRWAVDGVRPARLGLLATAIALAGVAMVSGLLFGAPAAAGTGALAGDAIAFVGTLGWIWYTRGAARLPGLDVLEYSALTVLAAWPLLLAAALLANAFGVSHAPSAEGLRLTWHALLFVGLVPSALCVLAFNYGVRTLGAVTGTAFLNFVPVSALLMGMALGKLPSANEAAGMAMVVGALLLHTAVNRGTATVAAAPGRHGAKACGATAA
ncbi:drug/metabolite transporter (DMT)-like permease [Variovorax sp. TBS-050B]|uniref:DMT family transporter n=1 Tax=Variovorax sp. TBS-050B TaxID=2940551 RepID=UPI0024743983|nr:DMT family transporter [Variovorax sp. TBS-050B]MDH6592909.1 drug/metabolite transporter (DMT)-like permease [Variovorax sp. TBS-050B]